MFFKKLEKKLERYVKKFERNCGFIVWLSFQIMFFVGCIIVYATPNMRGCWTKTRVFCVSHLQLASWILRYVLKPKN